MRQLIRKQIIVVVASLRRNMAGDGDSKSKFHCNIGGMRAKYKESHDTFTEKDLVGKDPFLQFRKWMEEAALSKQILEPNAMCLATANKNGTPSARYVLLKGYGTNGFDFFTNYASRKGHDLDENPQAALVFYWEPLRRSVRIEGKVEKVTDAESEEYFHSRPRDSQISASVSRQSASAVSREAMVEEMIDFAKTVGEGGEISRPKHWGGYRVVPNSIEFWQGQSNRLHDRIRFRKLEANELVDKSVTHEADGGWVYERLYP